MKSIIRLCVDKTNTLHYFLNEFEYDAKLARARFDMNIHAEVLAHEEYLKQLEEEGFDNIIIIVK